MAIHNAYSVKAGEKLVTKAGQETKWTALENSFVKRGKAYCKVQCKCSNIFTIRVAAIKDGKSNSCRFCAGILHRKAPKVGDKVGLWTVLQVSYPKNICQTKVMCECGKISWIRFHQTAYCVKIRGQMAGCRNCMGRRLEKLGLGLLVIWRNQWVPRMPWMTQEQAAFIARQNCFYCGNTPSNTYRRRHRTKRIIEPDWKYQGIDAVDYGLGHIQGNILPCCFLCNRAKNNETLETFCAWWNIGRLPEKQFTPAQLKLAATNFDNLLLTIQNL